ncbi:uncharacterized protein BXZ73DRAFT_100216 [Epithele typhae]|uniref:uncharacterized protein n=1 Tax=Epithele typhae TaxID=378194 RepID=UPI0020075CFC|nr:uncharacterized protein BXZ73DRAFT_100216 [Epithele typhae]KAH9936793.1 hypothetical protein BXZ73DRAFT_100216 [Epithele typhae]
MALPAPTECPEDQERACALHRDHLAPARCRSLTHSGNPFGCQIFAPGSTDLKLVATCPTKASDKLTIGLTTSGARSNQESAGVARAVDYMKGADDQCGNIFDPQLLSDLLSSPILTHLGWSVHVELAFDDNHAVFSSAPADESPLSAVPFTDNKLRYTELPELLALHVNRGGHEGHCAHLARWAPTFLAFNSLPASPSSSRPPASPSPARRQRRAWPSTSIAATRRSHVSWSARADGPVAPRPALDRVFVMANGDLV